jgi:hypothetical protein
MSNFDFQVPSGSGESHDQKFYVDAAERVFWTVAEAALAAIPVTAFDLPLWALPPIAAGLAAVKAFVAKHVGNGDSASTATDV